jgi:hypothetical protein
MTYSLQIRNYNLPDIVPLSRVRVRIIVLQACKVQSAHNMLIVIIDYLLNIHSVVLGSGNQKSGFGSDCTSNQTKPKAETRIVHNTYIVPAPYPLPLICTCELRVGTSSLISQFPN